MNLWEWAIDYVATAISGVVSCMNTSLSAIGAQLSFYAFVATAVFLVGWFGINGLRSHSLESSGAGGSHDVDDYGD